MVNVLQVLGGLALFLYGVQLLSNGMEKLAGRNIQKWLDRMTNKPVKGAAFGAFATGLLQSSSLLMITILGLVNANLLTLEQAVGVMLGTEIGTTLTAQIVAFDIGDLYLLFVALGFVMMEFIPRPGWRRYGEIIMGFGVLFLGMELMSGALKVLAAVPEVESFLATVGNKPLAGLAAGAIVTAVVQSSSAVTGLVVAMGMSGAITLPGAIALIIGANIGTCIDSQFVAALRLSRPAVRASVVQTLINVFGALLLLPFITPFAELISGTALELPRQIANAHTIFNVAVSAILLPFTRPLAALAWKLVPESEEEKKPKLTAFIDDMQHGVPVVALTEAHNELIRLGEVTAEMIKRSHPALVEGDTDAAQWIFAQESDFVDPVTNILENFVDSLMRQNLSEDQRASCFQFKRLLIDIERVGDLAEDLAEAAFACVNDNVSFSEYAVKDLNQLCEHVDETWSLALKALQTGDRNMAQLVCRMEDEFDRLYMKARQGHIDRLTTGVCSPTADVVYTEILRNLERISDHADNLGVSVMRVE
ncbi:MAG: Na/Pi cotransporter family protein [Chloroflexota bacterium]